MERLKLGIIGLDSTHFDAFYKIIKGNKVKLDIFYLYDDSIEVRERRVMEYPELRNYFHDEPYSCDCFMILNRFGDDHLKAFNKVAAFGKPTFIDKPIANNFKNAKEIYELAKSYKTPITSHSPLEFSNEFYEAKSIYKRLLENQDSATIIFSGPRECNDLGDDPRLKSALFYGIHLSELLSNMLSDNSIKSIASTNDQRTTLLIKDEMLTFYIDLYSNGNEFYNITFYNNDIGFKSIDIKLDGSYYDDFVSHLINFFQKSDNYHNNEKSLNAMKILEEVI